MASGRGSSELAAQTGVAVFLVAFERWLAGPSGASLADVVSGSFGDLKAVVLAG